MGDVMKRVGSSVFSLEQYDANFEAVNLLRVLPTGEWKQAPSFFRLLLKGTGTCTVESRNTLLVERTVVVYTAAAATNEIKRPFLGDDAIEIRVTLTGTCTAEVI